MHKILLVKIIELNALNEYSIIFHQMIHSFFKRGFFITLYHFNFEGSIFRLLLCNEW